MPDIELNDNDLERIIGGQTSLEEIEKQRAFLEELKGSNQSTLNSEGVELNDDELGLVEAGKTL